MALSDNVSWKIFALALTIIAAIFGYTINLVAKAEAEIKGYNSDVAEIKADVREVKTDVKWIKATLEDLTN